MRVTKAAFILAGIILLAAVQLAAAQAVSPKADASTTFAILSNGQPLQTPATDYLLGPFDKISVHVFGDDKLSVDKTQIDAGGQIVMPLIGPVTAGGKTASQLSIDIANKLGEKYLQSPQVSVQIDEAVSQRVTVSGAVVESGIYSLKGPTTLNQALALAKGPDMKVANLKHVAIFRQIDGKSARAVFDLEAIREGKAADPEVYGGDSIIVQGSGAKQFWREFIQALPAFSVFAYF